MWSILGSPYFGRLPYCNCCYGSCYFSYSGCCFCCCYHWPRKQFKVLGWGFPNQCLTIPKFAGQTVVNTRLLGKETVTKGPPVMLNTSKGNFRLHKNTPSPTPRPQALPQRNFQRHRKLNHKTLYITLNPQPLTLSTPKLNP